MLTGDILLQECFRIKVIVVSTVSPQPLLYVQCRPLRDGLGSEIERGGLNFFASVAVEYCLKDMRVITLICFSFCFFAHPCNMEMFGKSEGAEERAANK